ncbi:MAG TPA: hypothetical protein VFG68_22260 [Fimbriiglobus sp.]|nr:hypothetical protein [Fimbriiglobus sp.]
MAAKKKSTVEKLTGTVQDTASVVAKHVGKALGLTEAPKESGSEEVGSTATPAAPDPEPIPGGKRTTGKKTTTARMMTKPVVGKRKTAAARTMSRPVGDAAKPPKGRGDTGAKGPRRGASKGR